MTIITLETNNPQEIAEVLQSIADDMKKNRYDNCSGMHDGKDFEFMIMKEQKFITMDKFIPFDNTGNKLTTKTE